MTVPLANQQCKPCQGGIAPLKGDALQALTNQLENDWAVIDEHHLLKTFTFGNFVDAMAFANRVGQLAEDVNHHPTLEITWGKVVVTIWTHKINGLAEADFVFAAKADQCEAVT